MKRLGLLIVLIAIFSITDFAVAQNGQMPEKTLPENYVYQQPATAMFPVTIDNIDVPYEVLIYAKMAYQGYAVTQARETTWNGGKAYELRIDNGSNPYDNSGLFLIYDDEWKLVNEKAYYTPLPTNKRKELQSPLPEEPQPVELPVEVEIEDEEPVNLEDEQPVPDEPADQPESDDIPSA